MIQEYLNIAIKNLQKRKVRSALTLLGILIAVTTIFVLVSVSLGLQGAVEEQFQTLGVDKIFVQPRGQLAGPGTGGAVSLTQIDVDVIEKIQGIKETSSWAAKPAKVEYKDQSRFVNVIGIELEKIDLAIQVGDYKAEQGRLLSEKDTGLNTMIGSQYRDNNVFKKPLTPSDKLIINNQEFKIRGTLRTVGNPADDKLVFIPLEQFRILFDIPERIDTIVVQIHEDEDINKIAENIQRKLEKSRNVDSKNRDFTILTPEELLESFGQILSVLTGFLLAVAGISLLVGGIGIANTMYTSVLERTREIGTMKAVGARNSHILKIFLTEAGILGLLGGILGVTFGIAIAKGIEWIAVNQLATSILQTATPPWLILGCLAFAFFSGTLSGIWPALKAANTNTVEALRYE
jgi:putative ABC transport system permease protein